MIDLPYRQKFDVLPEVGIQELVDYFNLELSLEGGSTYSEDDFEYIGIFELDGFERMCWTVRGMELCAIVRPFEDSYIIEMDLNPA